MATRKVKASDQPDPMEPPSGAEVIAKGILSLPKVDAKYAPKPDPNVGVIPMPEELLKRGEAPVVVSPPETKPSAPDTDPVRTVMIELPVRRTAAYTVRHLRDLSPRHAQTLRDVTDGLIAEGRTLGAGRPVADMNDALAWILERAVG